MLVLDTELKRLLAVFDDMDSEYDGPEILEPVQNTGNILRLVEPDLLGLLVLAAKVDTLAETVLLDVVHLDAVVVDIVNEGLTHVRVLVVAEVLDTGGEILENRYEGCPVVEGIVTVPIPGDYVPVVPQQLEEHVQLGDDEGVGILELEHLAQRGHHPLITVRDDARIVDRFEDGTPSFLASF